MAVIALIGSGLLASSVPAALADAVPVATDDLYPGDAGEHLIVAAPGVLANDSDADGYQTLVMAEPAAGTVSLGADGSFDYDPQGATGEHTFTYCLIAAPGGGNCVSNTATVALFIAQPFVDLHFYSTVEGETLTVPAPGLLEGSRNPGPNDSLYQVSSARDGVVSDFRADGSFVYAPDAEFTGTDAFAYCWSNEDVWPLCSGNTGSVTITVTEAEDVETTTTLTGPDSVFYEQTAELTATVVPDVNGGSVAFSSGGALVPDCHAIPVTGSVATCTVPAGSLGIGDHTYVAAYSGAGDFLPSISAPLTLTVNPAPTALAYTGDSSGTIGSPIQVSAELTNAADGATGPIPGQSLRFGMANGLSCTADTNAAGIASCSLTANRVGNLAVTVAFNGDDRYQGQQIDGVANIAKMASTTSVQAAPNPTPWGADVTLSATVTAGATGTVGFDVGGTAIGGCAAVPVTDSGAVCITDGLDVGSQQITAHYSGDATYADSSGSTTVQVTQRAVNLVHSGLPTGVVGDAYEIVGTATDALTGEPVAGLFLYLSFQGLTCGDSSDAAGIGNCEVRLKRAGTSDATVQFDGDARYVAATGSGPVTISKAMTRTTSTVDVTDPEFGDPVTITASVLPTDGGTVAFNDGGEPLAGCDAVPLVSSGGGSADPWIATCTTRTLAVGPHTLESIFSGTDNYSRSAGSTFATVSAAPSVLSYTGPTGGTVGAPLAVSAALTTGDTDAALAGQTIAFTWGELSCTATTGDDGTATCELPITAAAQAGTLTATFAGTDNYLESSATADISVAASSTSTVVTAPETAAFGTEVTIDAVVTPSEGAGTIAFTVADAPITDCEAVTPIQLDGTWTARCVTSTLPIGTNDIAAVFSGTADYLTSFGTTTVTIEAAPTALTYTGPTSGTVGASLPVSAVLTNVATDTALAGQTVEFGWGELTCTATTGDDGAASCELPTTATAQAGELTVSFAGTTEYTESSATADISVDPAATKLDYLGETDGTVDVPLAVSAGISLIEPATPATTRDQPGDGLHSGGAFLTAAAPAAMELAGLRLQFALGAATCEGITDAGGVASCSLNPTAADEQAELIVTFAGTADLTAAELAVRLAVAAAPVPPAEPTGVTTPTAPTAPPSTTSGPRSSDPDSSSSSSASSSSSSSGAAATPANPPSAGGLATTGVDIGGWVRTALLLLGVGALLLLAGRFSRRRTGPRLH